MPDTPHTIPDAAQRERALAADASFIVQAPAGSGKTELLTQRVLRLLAVVDEPEEILAMTFTRKAAAEMRQRILGALHAAHEAEPDEAHKRRTWQLGRQVLARDDAQGWDLTNNPSRLRVLTIDGLCAGLTRQLPLLSRLGGNLETVEDARPLYLAAARNTLAALDDADVGHAVGVLLGHLENNTEKTAGLIADLLARREQWLGKLLGHDSRVVLEAALADSVGAHLATLHSKLSSDLACTLAELAHFAYQQRVIADKKPALLAPFADRTAPPKADVAELPAWQAVAELCLTSAGAPRSRLTVSEGFPADKKNPLFVQRKAQMQDCLAVFKDNPDLTQALAAVRQLPAPRFVDAQWQVLEALVQVLLRAAAELQLVFATHGQGDFAEVHARALLALGESDAPTDLALALDYRLRHILVDEFQDTSSGQYELLEKLTAGWQQGDGRTLFVVGDPMQSIYAFRQAEVGLYLQARTRGIGQIRLEPLELTVNFRSVPAVVAWVNQAFPAIFPANEDATTGAVRYSPSQPHRRDAGDRAVRIHAQAARDDLAEASQVVALVRTARQEDPTGSIAVLARSRNHLSQIARALQQAGLAYRAVDVDRLGQLPAVQDMHSLHRALRHPADRVAWLSLLRTPMIGLTLADLLLIAGEDSQTIPDRLRQGALPDRLSPDGRTRMARVLPVLDATRATYRRRPLRDWLLGCWQALGGAACLRSDAEHAAVQSYLELVTAHDRGGELADPDAFDDALERLFAPPDASTDDSLQLMTMHKSKGLEFDTVILPGLGRAPRREDKPLITWLERPNPAGETQVLIAPIKPAHEERDGIFDFIWGLNRQKQTLETARLLYVAATRARGRLHLLGHVGFDSKDGQPKPAANSLLAALWPAVASSFEGLTPPTATATTDTPLPKLARLAADWQSPPQAPVLDLPPPSARGAAEAIPFDWAGQTARHVGTLVHRYLERIGNEGSHAWDPGRIDNLAGALRVGLLDLGVPPDALDSASERALAMLQRTLADPRGRWILDSHPGACCEWALTEATGNGVINHVIDRSFIDAEGVRWIVDYKTGDHAGSDLDTFLDQEQARYAAQLAGYARVVRALESRPVRVGLYYPAMAGWRTWEP